MVAYIGEMSVKRRQWLSQETFKNGVVLCQSIPGATAMQTAAYVGLRTGGIIGALSSYVGFGLPAFLFMVILSSLYAASRDLPWITSLFAGLQVIVVALVAHATYAFGKTSLKGFMEVFLAAAAAFAFFIGISPFYVIVGTALAGISLFRVEIKEERGMAQKAFAVPVAHLVALLSVALVGIVCLYFLNARLFKLALLMLKVDLFAFGGGFASVPLMLHEVVDVQRWIDGRTFMDGIALGQITPGPIVITATFVGYLIQGFFGALVATIAIFTPSFVLLVVTAPFFDQLKESRLFSMAIKGILTSFVGLLLFVTIKFAVVVPWDLLRILLVVGSFLAILRKIDILYIVPIGAAISLTLLR